MKPSRAEGGSCYIIVFINTNHSVNTNYINFHNKALQQIKTLTCNLSFPKDSELRELRRIIDAMAQDRSTSSSVLNDQNSAKPPFSPSSLNNLTSSNATTPVATIADNGEMEEETSNSLPPGTPKSTGVRKGGWVSDFMNISFVCFKNIQANLDFVFANGLGKSQQKKFIH